MPALRTGGLALALCVAGGCQVVVPEQPEDPARLQRGAAEHREFVVFAQRVLRIETLGVPIEPPVTVGSLASATTMASDAPEVVTVTPDGRLLALKAGRTRVRGTGTGSVLEVEVAAQALTPTIASQTIPEVKP